MTDKDLAPLLGRNWKSQSHREALAYLVRHGWDLCGAGDWAVALRSPGGALVARVCPVDPAHAAFLTLCLRCTGNPYLPRIDFDTALDGGGWLTVMEFLPSVEEGVAVELARRWHDEDEDNALAAVRHEARAIDDEFRTRVPWWGGLDLNENNVRQSVSGHLTLIDVFWINGPALYGQILQDPAVVRSRIPENQRRYLLEIPFHAREKSPADLQTLRRTWNEQ